MPNIQRLVLIFFALLFLNQLSSAQNKLTINGNVTDSGSGETLIGASVKLVGPVTTGAVTNSYGFYSISAPAGKYQLAVSFIGYKTDTQTVDLSKSLKINIALAESNQLDEVVISGEKRNENVVSPQMGLQKITVKEINNVPVLLGERDVL